MSDGIWQVGFTPKKMYPSGTLSSQKLLLKLINLDQTNHRMCIAHKLLNDDNNDPELLKRFTLNMGIWL